ncbi:uncharacterized protein TNCV_3102411 [Trichonephila clavipes]|nr:uncharacterized protein TNCV_3102411 [Trichonephila clavipes]
MGFKSGEYTGHSIRVISSLSSCSSTARVQCGRTLSSIKMKSGHLRTDAHGEEVPLHNSNPRLQTLYRKCGAQFASSAYNASPEKNSRITVMVFFFDVTGIKPCPNLSPNQNALRIASGTEPTLIRKEDTTPLISCPVFVLSVPL